MGWRLEGNKNEVWIVSFGVILKGKVYLCNLFHEMCFMFHKNLEVYSF